MQRSYLIGGVIAVILFALAVLLSISDVWPKYQALLATLLAVASIISAAIAGSAAKRHREWIMKSGVPAQALIREVRKEGGGDGGSGVRLMLEVRVEGRAPYRAEATLLVGVSDPKLVFHEGSTVQVFLDPKDPNHVVVPSPGRLLVR